MHVLFVEPSFPYYQKEFVRGLRDVGARVTGIGETLAQDLKPELKDWLYGYEYVPSVVNEDALYEAVRRVQAREWVDRLEATVEAHILPTARVREACSIPGTSVRTAFLCRDKPAMKEALRQAGVPCARSIGTTSAEEARQFAAAVGFPLILKPRDAAGASGTHRASNPEELERALHASGLARGQSTAVEEFVEGHEGFYDTMCIQGNIAHEFVTHYFPNVLEAMRTRWISPQLVVTNRLSDPSYKELKALGKRVIEVLGIGTSPTHMEWFFGPRGLKFSEIGCRPPGVGAWDLYGHANDLDLYKDWAHAIVHGSVTQTPSRKYCTALINLRPDRDGVIVGYEGLDTIQQEFGSHILDRHLPSVGTATQPVESGYMANAWIRMRHEDFDALRHMLDVVGRTVKVRAG